MRRLTLSLAFFVALAGAARAEALSPEETVKQYLSAVQNQKFERAYELVSRNMKRGQSKEAWVKQSQYIMAFSEAKIFDFKIFPGKIEGERATVPNILSSQDKFLNQLALEEDELYTLVKEEGLWKVDSQRIAEGAELKQFFPKKTAKQ